MAIDPEAGSGSCISLGAKLVGAAIATALSLVLIEGCASLVLRTYEVLFVDTGVFERRFTRYDELLGWVNVSGIDLPEVYGPGTVLRTNSQGFRGVDEYALEVPPGRTRVICSGDSYAFGVDVSDGETWCHQLSVLAPTLETVNMGLPGYGIDQSFLWYRRDAERYAHDVQIFSFITDDFRRMGTSTFLGYGKPILAIRGGELVVDNTPVPRAAYIPFVMGAFHALDGLRMVEFTRAVIRRTPLVREATPERSPDEIRTLAVRVFEELAAINKRKGSVLLLVYLPSIYDFHVPEQAAELRSFMREVARERSIPFLDVVEVYLRLPLPDAQHTFVRLQGGHYSARGNDWVARQILERLRGIGEPRRHGATAP